MSPPKDAAIPYLPSRFAAVIPTFAPLFLQRSWRHAEVLLTGAIPARERRFVNYYRVLNRVAWCPRVVWRTLLGLLVAAFVPRRLVVPGIDDTIERRRGKRIAAKGIHCDPVRSSHGHFVKTSGLRWLSLMLLAPVPPPPAIRLRSSRWLPHRRGRSGHGRCRPLAVLAPSERYCQQRGRRHT